MPCPRNGDRGDALVVGIKGIHQAVHKDLGSVNRIVGGLVDNLVVAVSRAAHLDLRHVGDYLEGNGIHQVIDGALPQANI